MKRIIVLCLLLISIPLYAVEKEYLFEGDNNFPPYEYIDHDGNYVGFNIDIVKAVAEVMDLKVRIKLDVWANVRSDLETGRADGLAGMFYSAERAKKVSFCLPHMLVSYAIFFRSDSSIKTMDDITNRNVIVQNGDIMHDYLKGSDLRINIYTRKDPLESLTALSMGLYDCAVLPRIQGIYYLKKENFKNLRYIDFKKEPFRYGIALKKGNTELLNIVNEGLTIIQVTGRYNKIYDKWFRGYDKNIFEKKDYSFLWYIVIPFLGLALLGGIKFCIGYVRLYRSYQECSKQVEKMTSELEASLLFNKMCEKVSANMKEVFWVEDLNGKGVLHVSPLYEQVFGRSSDSLVNDMDVIYDFIPAADLDSFKKVFAHRGSRVCEMEVNFLKSDGEIFEAFVRSIPFDDAAASGRVVWIVSDTSERNRMRDCFEKAAHYKEESFILQHRRIKDILQLVSSVVNLQAREISEPKLARIYRESLDRIHAISILYDKAYDSESGEEVNFKDYLNTLVSNLAAAYSYLNKDVVFTVHSEDAKIKIDQAIPLALISSEMISNSFLHAFEKGRGGSLFVELRVDIEKMCHLKVRDDGIGLPEGFTIDGSGTFGMKLIKNLADQLKGRVTLEKIKSGTSFIVMFPVE